VVLLPLHGRKVGVYLGMMGWYLHQAHPSTNPDYVQELEGQKSQ
jgi:hypothetical protein